MENLLSALLLTLSTISPFGTTVQSGQVVISSQTTTTENQSQMVTQGDLEREFYDRISQVRPWLPTPTPSTIVFPTPKPPIPPTPPLSPNLPILPTSPVFPTPVLSSPTLTPIIMPIEFNRLEKHRL